MTDDATRIAEALVAESLDDLCLHGNLATIQRRLGVGVADAMRLAALREAVKSTLHALSAAESRAQAAERRAERVDRWYAANAQDREAVAELLDDLHATALALREMEEELDGINRWLGRGTSNV